MRPLPTLLLLLCPALFGPALFGKDKPPDPCQLLAPGEIAKVEGSAPISNRGNTQDDGKLGTSQCFFSLTPFTQSISLELIEQSTKDKLTVQEFWNEKFHEKHSDEEEGDGKSAPRPVPGVGEEAFWVNSGRDGALYCLQGKYIVRIGIGGKDGDRIMLQHASALAKSALKNLSKADAAP